jgi:hypothetical protein
MLNVVMLRCHYDKCQGVEKKLGVDKHSSLFYSGKYKKSLFNLNISSVYMTMAFAGVALMAAMVVGVVIIRRRNGRHPHHQVPRSSQGHFSKDG